MSEGIADLALHGPFELAWRASKVIEQFAEADVFIEGELEQFGPCAGDQVACERLIEFIVGWQLEHDLKDGAVTERHEVHSERCGAVEVGRGPAAQSVFGIGEIENGWEGEPRWELVEPLFHGCEKRVGLGQQHTLQQFCGGDACSGGISRPPVKGAADLACEACEPCAGEVELLLAGAEEVECLAAPPANPVLRR